MQKEETVLRTNYKPGRTVEELEDEHLEFILKNTTYEDRFRKLMRMIRASQQLERAKNQALINYKSALNGH